MTACNGKNETYKENAGIYAVFIKRFFIGSQN